MKRLLITVFWLLATLAVFSQPIAQFSTNDSIGCYPFNVQFSDASTNAVSWFWDFGDGNTSVSQNPSHTYTSSGSFTVQLIVTAANTTKDTLEINNLITVGQKPTALFTATGTTGCPNTNSVIFSNTSLNANSYLWDFGDGNTSALPNPNHSYSIAGNYTVTLVATNNLGCNNVITKNNFVQILQPPVVDFIIDTNFACDTSKVFSFTKTSGIGINYSWDFGDGNYASTANATHQYSNDGIYDVALTVTGTNGCANTKSYSNAIEVKPYTKPPFHLNKYLHCGPIAIYLYSDINGMAAYNWDFGDNTYSSLNDPNHVYQPGTYDVKLTVTDSLGCQYSHTKNNILTVYPRPNLGWTLSDSIGCNPLNIDFTDNSTGAVSHRWIFGDGDTSYAQNPNHTYTNAGIYNVHFTAYGPDTVPNYAPKGCWSVVNIPTPIIVNEANPKFKVSDSTGCEPLSVDFTDVSNNAVSWFWDFGDGNTSTQQHPTHTYLTAGNYTITYAITNSNGCTDTVVLSDKIKVGQQNINYVAPSAVESCAPFTANFNAASFTYNNWKWHFGDGDSSSIVNPIHTYTKEGTYVVTLETEAANGCPAFIDTFAVYKIDGIEADFTYAINNCPDYEVQFTDSSSNAVSWFWDFGDGNTSTQQNPLHQYAGGGYYTVQLTVTNAQGCTNTKIVVNSILLNSCQPNGPMTGGNGGGMGGGNTFTACSPLDIDFSNPYDSTIAWYWSFGDGDTSNIENPSHTYSQNGEYDVLLIVEYQKGGFDTMTLDSHIVTTSPTAKFGLAETLLCQTLEVQLSDSSINAIKWDYDFGDGNTSTLPSPNHTYTNWGNFYNLMLSVEDTLGCVNTTAKNIFVGVSPASFVYDYEVCLGDTVWFTSNLNGYASYTWYFGDGDSLVTKNGWHIYNTYGSFQPSLKVTDNGNCTYTHTLPSQVKITEPNPLFTINGVLEKCNSIDKTFNNLSTNYDSLFWDFDNGVTHWGSTPPQVNYNIHGEYVVTLTAYKNGCSKTYQSPDTIKIFKPVADFTFIQNRTCLPITVTFTNQSQNSSSYTWYFGDGNTSTAVNPMHTFTTAPTKQIQLVANDNKGCQNSIFKANVDVFTPAFTISVNTSCVGEQVSFTDASNNAASWFWDFGDGNTSTQQNPTHSYTNAGVYSVTLIAESQDGCFDTLTIDSAVKVGNPIADFTSPTTANCAPSLVDFTNLSTGASSWSWSFGDTSYSSKHTPSHVYVTPGAYDIKLVVIDSLGCTDSITKPNYVKVYGPIPNFSISNVSGCEPVTVSFTDSSLFATKWKWSFGDGDTSTSQNPSHIYTSVGNYVVSLEVADSFGCTATMFADDTIKIHPTPQAAFIVSDTVGCLPLQVNFTNNSIGATAYKWDFGGNNTSTNNSPTNTYLVAGSYTPQLIVSNFFACHDTAYGKTVQVNPVPVADFQVLINAGCPPFTVSIQNQSTGGSGVTYQWLINNNVVSTDSVPTVSLTNAGWYSIGLVVTNSAGCSDTLNMPNAFEVFQVDTPAQVPIRFVSVTSDESVKVEWKESTSSSFMAYVLYRKNQAGNFEVVDSIFDVANLVYTENNLSTLENVYCYKLQTINHCNATQSIEQLTAHCTMNISATAKLEGGINVTWTPYIGGTVDNYQLYRLDDSGNMTEHVAEIPANTFQYLDGNGICPKLHRYKVVAENINGDDVFSLSDTAHAMPINTIGEQKPAIARTTVIDNEHTLTEWAAPNNYPEKVMYYNIYRSEDTTDFVFIDQVSGQEIQYIDYDTRVSEQNYYYQIEVINICEVAAGRSGTASSILLTVDKKGDDKNLEWTEYREWENGVGEYIVEKKMPNGEWEEVKKVDGKTTRYTDPY